ncbi:hypothetical protein [Arthrobacter bambusae]|uniref:Uncharacterized protein n=1 Tax=Arthrobacter bambusae TaxID=1338426 RepID=A0AAW8DC27_9MICC|nr:hypothetical protein [Arthrobacter bambusae]MDP9903167.1 hypothetical protein [Arthrobacter bambusae]MDQ0128839.1 hypothetical protein [Arthrobacter bambusae]MDQ0180180.1 hypothetical protein [Arthrobacter bambusae]
MHHEMAVELPILPLTKLREHLLAGNSISKRVILASTAADTLAALNPLRTGRPAPDPRVVAEKLLAVANLWLTFASNAVPTHRAAPGLRALSPEQLALCLIVLHRAMTVPSPTPATRSSNRILVWDGPAPVAALLPLGKAGPASSQSISGQFREGRFAVSAVAHRYDAGASSHKIGRVMTLLHQWAPTANTLRHPAQQHTRAAHHPIDLTGGA